MNAHAWQTVQELFAEACELTGDARAAYLDHACNGSTELRAEVDSLLAAHERSAGFLEAAPERVGPYRLLEPVGRGGMGAVYRAERDDGQFRQQVAIKLLPAAPSDFAFRRFLEERQILANLSHPNIARLLDGGATGGVPYIVMEYVDGPRVDAWCAGLPVSQRLALFRQVCAAVQYAHQNLVIHRDLKPANILVTAAGEPKLLDFGIAGLMTGRPASATLPLMTPEYASPEQQRGEPVSTAADVYSLGVVLHEILTGRRPGTGTAATGSADLDAILRQALDPAAERRYPSAQALSDDLERYLHRRPVHARRGGPWYRAGRFVSRNRSAVAIAAVSLLLVVFAAGLAWRQYGLAHRRFQDARRFVRSVLYEEYDRMAALPGSTGLRQHLVAGAIDYLTRLSRDAAGDRGLQLEIALAYLRLGDVQGLPSQPNLGDAEGALTSYRNASRLLRAIPRFENDAEAGNGFAAATRRASLVLAHLRRPAEAIAAAAEAVAFMEKAAARDGSDTLREQLAGAYSNMADVAPDPAPWRLKALAIFDDQLRKSPDHAQRRRNVALTNKYIAAPLLRRAFGEQALPYLKRAETLDAARLAAHPGDREAQMDLSFDYSQNATFYSNRDRYAEALENYRRALTIRRELAASDPADTRLQDRLVYAHSRIASTLQAMNRPIEALESRREAVRISGQLLARNPRQPQFRSSAAKALSELSMHPAGKAEGCRNRAGALALYQQMETEGQMRDEDRNTVAELRKVSGCP